MAEVTEPMPTSPFVDKDGYIMPDWSRWLERRAVASQTDIGSILSGFNTLQSQTSTQIAAEATARIAGDTAVAGAGDGSGDSNSGAFSSVVSSAATWVVAKSLTLTPGGAGGDYTIDILPDLFVNGALSAGEIFNGNWKVTEELSGGGTEHTLDSGTFTLTYTPESSTGSEGGGEPIVFPEYWTVAFTGLPSGLIAANEAAQVDIKLQIQRASGTNEITAPGLSGSMSVSWTA